MAGGCARSPLYRSVENDLRLWEQINEHTMQRAIDSEAQLTLAWHRGSAFVVDSAASHRRLRDYPHFFRIEYAAYLLDMIALEESGMIPTSAAAELIIRCDDKTLDPAMSANETPAVGRYNRRVSGKRSPSPEIRIPSWAFRIRNFDSAFLGPQLEKNSRRYPWETKIPKLFGRYSPYPSVESRLIERGSNVSIRRTREYFVAQANKWLPPSMVDLKTSTPVKKRFGGNSTAVDVEYTKVEMLDWPRHKYLLCLAGITWSGTCEMLLTLSSVPFFEESGYATYYSSNLVPFEHYIPFWREYPDDVAEGFAWVQADDARAKRVAENARLFAARHLTLRARQCYWREVIASLTRKELYFRRAVASGRRKLIPVREYLHVRAQSMMQQANSALDGAGSCLMRCNRAPPGRCTRPCMY